MSDVISSVVEQSAEERLATGTVNGVEVQLRTTYWQQKDQWKVTATASNGQRESTDLLSEEEARARFERLVGEYELLVVR